MIYIPILLVALWVLFLAYTALYANWNSLRPEVKVVGALVVFFGLLVDTGINWTVGLTLGVTKDWTLSQKCGRLKRSGGWRATVATYLCRTWLDPFQLGGHCR